MADLPITTATASLGTTGADTLLRFLATQFVRIGRNMSNPLRYVMDVSAEIASVGQTVGVYVAPEVSSALLTDGNAKSLNDSAGTTANVTLNRNRISSFSLTTMARAMDGDFTSMKLLDTHIRAVLNGVEEDVLSLATSFTTNAFAGTFNTALTEAECVEAVQKLMDQRAPGPYVGIVDPGATSWSALMQIANFVQARGASNPWVSVNPNWGAGYFWNETFWYPSQAVNVTGTSTSNLVFSPSAIAVAMRLPPPPKGGGVIVENVVDGESGIALQILHQYDSSRLADEAVVRCLYGYAVTRNAFGVELRS